MCKSETELTRAMNEAMQAPLPRHPDLAHAMARAHYLTHYSWNLRDRCGLHWVYAQKRKTTEAIRAALAVNNG